MKDVVKTVLLYLASLLIFGGVAVQVVCNPKTSVNVNNENKAEVLK